jgi:hypothetical protein
MVTISSDDHDENKNALLVVNILISELRRAGRPVSPWILAYGRRLNMQSVMSREGLHSDDAAAQSKSGPEILLGSGAAARILGLSTRQMSRIAGDLEGQKISNRWYYRRSVVVEYANAKEEKRDAT